MGYYDESSDSDEEMGEDDESCVWTSKEEKNHDDYEFTVTLMISDTGDNDKNDVENFVPQRPNSINRSGDDVIKSEIDNMSEF